MVFRIQSQYLPVFPLSQVVTMFTPRADTRGRPHRKPKRAGPRDARAQLSAPGAEAQPGTSPRPPARRPAPRRAGVLTQLAHFQDVAQHPGQLDAAAAEGAFVLIFSAAVLQHDLQGGKGTGPGGT